jgi:hypothetical protein
MRPDRRRIRVAVLLRIAALCALLCGCAFEGLGPPLPPLERTTIGYRRLALVEFFDRSGHPEAARQFSASLREKIEERTVGTDVVLVPGQALPSLGDPFVDGALPVDVLVRARRDYMAGVLIIGCINSHDPYPAPSVHLSMKVIDTGTASVIYETADGWDGNHQVVRDAIDEYYRRNIRRDDCRLGPKVFLVSPSYFLRFVAATVANDLVDAI